MLKSNKIDPHPTWVKDVAPASWQSRAKANEKAKVAKTKAMHDNITRAIPSGDCSLTTPDT